MLRIINGADYRLSVASFTTISHRTETNDMIATASPERNSRAPDVPTFREQDFDVVIKPGVGFSGPAEMYPKITQTVHDTTLAIFVTAPVKKRRFL